MPCDYFHAVVTVPSELRTAFRRNQKLLYGLLMQVSATAVKDLCAHKRHLGALPGMLSVLHTWNGQLGYHPHVHLLITGGGITADGQHWEPARGEFLVPVAVLSRKIAAQFRAALKATAPAIFAEIPARRLAPGVGLLLQALRPRKRRGAELSVAVCLSDSDQQRTDSRHGPIPCDFPLERPQRQRRGAPSGYRALSSSGASLSTSCREVFTRSDTTGSGTPRSETSPIVPGCF